MTLGTAGLAAVIPAGPASAASGACTTSGATVTCTCTETGAAQTWTVPGQSCSADAAGCHVTVTFGGKPALVEFVRPGEIGVVSPPGSGTVTVTVTVGGVSSQATAARQFTYIGPLFGGFVP